MYEDEGDCMENRERDRMSERDSSTEAGDLNRRVESEKGRQNNSGTSAEFGQKIGRSENLEGGDMQNRDVQNPKEGIASDSGREPGRNSGSENFDSSGRTGTNKQPSDVKDVSSEKDFADDDVDRGSMRGGSGSSEGRH